MNENRVVLPENISVLAGARESVAYQVDQPYSENACSYLDTVAKLLLSDSEARKFPDVISFAFWCRKANVAQHRLEWESREQGRVRLGRGLVFHVAPSNVPVNFAFSFVFSLLAGNGNIVRVPSRPFPQIDIVCAAIDAAFADYPLLRESNTFIRYAIDHETTTCFSASADCRILWGGDATVSSIRSLPAKPRCIDVSFPDRYSIAIMDVNRIANLDEASLRSLAEGFYNDTYLMDQNACSSPQIVFWVGASERGKELFWSALLTIVRNKYDLQAAVSVDKYVQLCEDVIEGVETGSYLSYDGHLVRVDITHIVHEGRARCDFSKLRGKGGYFYEASVKSPDEIMKIVTQKFQTVTYFGIDPQDIVEALRRNKIGGIDRIVAVGSAMDIDIVWDGYDLASALSRTIEVR